MHREPGQDYIYRIKDNKVEDRRRVIYVSEKEYVKLTKQIQQQLQTLTTGKVTMYTGDDETYEYLEQFVKI